MGKFNQRFQAFTRGRKNFFSPTSLKSLKNDSSANYTSKITYKIPLSDYFYIITIASSAKLEYYSSTKDKVYSLFFFLMLSYLTVFFILINT